MALTPQDRIECRDIAHTIVHDVLEEYNQTHIASCPYGKSLAKYIMLSIGIAIGSGAASAGLVLGAVKLMGG